MKNPSLRMCSRADGYFIRVFSFGLSEPRSVGSEMIHLRMSRVVDKIKTS